MPGLAPGIVVLDEPLPPPFAGAPAGLRRIDAQIREVMFTPR